MIKLIIVCCLCLVMAGCNGRPAENAAIPNTNSRPQVTSVGVVKVTPLETTITRGQSGEAIVRLKIDNGYHVNANPPTFAYLIPTQLQISPPAGITVESITYPQALTKKFSFAEQPLAVYEGETDVKVKLGSATSAPAGAHNLSAKLRVQACDDQVCYAPGSIDLTLPVSIK